MVGYSSPPLHFVDIMLKSQGARARSPQIDKWRALTIYREERGGLRLPPACAGVPHTRTACNLQGGEGRIATAPAWFCDIPISGAGKYHRTGNRGERERLREDDDGDDESIKR